MKAAKAIEKLPGLNNFTDDVVGDDDSDIDEYEYGGKDGAGGKKTNTFEDAAKVPDYMQFDFRKGISAWPENCEVVDAKAAETLIEEATSVLEEAAKTKKTEKEGKDKDGKSDSKSKNNKSYGGKGKAMNMKTTKVPDNAVFELVDAGTPTSLIIQPGIRLKFDLSNLMDGGDEANAKRKKKLAALYKKYGGGGGRMEGFGGGGESYSGAYGPTTEGGYGPDDDFDVWEDYGNYGMPKQYVNEYTITMDIKLLKDPPREGISLFQTALIHSEENKRTGKTTLTKSDGECIVNQAGGIGMFGTYGDTTKARLEVGKWKRIVITVKCPNNTSEKGEMRTWIGTEPGVVLREDTITANERFAIVADQFFLFSSGQQAMMPGSIALRYFRIEKVFSTDADVKANRARDKVISVFNEDREKEAEQQRKGLSLAPIFAKPRPMWSAPVFIGTFGDNFIERTNLEGTSILAWSYSVVNYAIQEMGKTRNHPLLTRGLGYPARVAIADTLNILQKSSEVFKFMAKMFKNPSDTQLLSFLRKLKRFLNEIGVKESLLLPVLVENKEILLLLERTSERLFTVVVIQTDPMSGLRNHSATVAGFAPEIKFRVCMVLKDVPKKNALDDVFWTAVYNLSIHVHEGDMHKFYDVLIPFLTGKPLEISLVEAETVAAKYQDFCGYNVPPDLAPGSDSVSHLVHQSQDSDHSPRAVSSLFGNMSETGQDLPNENLLYKYVGDWRAPQRSSTSYVRCIYEAIHYILRGKGLTALQSKQVHLAIGYQMVTMALNDLSYMTPEDNGQRVCNIALRELSRLSVDYVDEVKAAPPLPTHDASGNIIERDLSEEPDVPAILKEVHRLVEMTTDALSFCKNEEEDVPPQLDLTGLGAVPAKTGVNDPQYMQFMDSLLWDTEDNEPDPGQIINLRKYIPIDMLQIPKKARTRDEAITALHLCDRVCTLIDNQAHCIKNDKHLIVALIEHVFSQVIPVPKPRGIQLSEEDLYRSERSKRRAERKKAEADELTKKKEEKRLKDEKEGKIAESKIKKRKDKEEKKKKEEKEEAAPPPVKCFGEEILPDFEAGKKEEKRLSSTPCIWDQPMIYEMQVEVMLTLHRLMEHFAAAAFSIQQTRSFDAVCITIPGCIAAIADAVMRKLATNEPSEVCAHLMGRCVDGRQLGHPGFGLSVGTFATQSETIEVHSPELHVARTAILDYFMSPEQKRLQKIFSWEEQFPLIPGKNLITFLRNVCREIGIAESATYAFICEAMPHRFTALMRSYPELKCFRDICFWWKYFLNPDRKAFPNYSDPEEPKDVDRFPRTFAQLVFNWDGDAGEFKVKSFRKDLYCCPEPVKGQVPPIHRFPSTATPSFYLPPPVIKTEDDVIYRPNLPSFANSYGQVLNQRDSELLLSYLTVPYMRLPLVLTFFSSEDRIHKLQSEELRFILDSVLFEPGRYLACDATGVEPVMVPTRHPELLATPYGLLINELYRSPDTIIRCVLNLLKGALAVDTGSVVDEGAKSFNMSSTIIMYICRMAARVDNYMSFLIDWKMGRHDCIDGALRDVDISQDVLDKLIQGRVELREILHDKFDALFEDYLKRLDLQTAKDPSNETLIDRNSRLACDLHSHKIIMYRNFHEEDITPKSAKAIVASFVYLTTRHTWNKAVTKEGARLQMPETELYELLQVMRRRLVSWLTAKHQADLDEVMQTALQVSSSLTGSFKTKADVLDSQNRWSRIQGNRSCGRWAVGFTRTVTQNEETSTDEAKSDSSKPLPKPTLERRHSINSQVGEIADTGQLGVEIDVQVGQMTLRSKHLAALPPSVANHPDVKLIFGEATIQASLLENADNRRRYRLVGLNHELEYWEPHKSCHTLGDEWERDYDPGDLYPQEKWIVNLFEPVRKSFFDGPQPKAMQFMMVSQPLPEDAEVAVLLGLHQTIGGPWKLVYLFRRLRCVHVYECVSQGRQWWYTLHMTTDTRYCLREMQADTQPRRQQYPHWWIRGSGDPYPMGVDECLMNIIDGGSVEPSKSILVIRETQHVDNLSGGREVLVPARLLFGAVPHALLVAYRFWQDESIAPRGTTVQELAVAARGYKRLLGYPVDKDGEYMVIIEMQYVGSFQHFQSKKGNQFCLQSSGLPGRTVRITRRPKKLFIAEFRQRQRVASILETLNLLVPPAPKKKKEDDAAGDDELLFKVDDEVECDYEGKGEYWSCIVRRVNDNGTYDLEYTADHKWVGVQREVDPDLVQKLGEAKKRAGGEGVYHWAGMTDSEDDDWKENSDKEKDEDDSEKKQKDRINFFQFDDLHELVDAADGDELLLERALRHLASIPGPEPFTIVSKLARSIEEVIKTGVLNRGISSRFPALASSNGSSDTATKQEKLAPVDSEDMYLLNLLYAPRRSRLCSVLKVLARIENASHICAWTSAKHADVKKSSTAEGISYGCPPIDLIELPRLKLAFVARYDHEGNYRLYSQDHVDLFITNERNPMTSKMLAGIPHSLLLSNIRGETQVLVPVIPPVRPVIQSDSFSTFIVLDRKSIPVSERFFLYPVHVSLSFLLTKGINSAVYLMVLRFLHRDYEDVFRLADSIATDTSLNEEGMEIFKCFKFTNDDWHPDAHACRLKISLVTMDSGMKSPWDLTIECSRHVVKLGSVSSSCRLAPEEELQLLEAETVAVSEDSKAYDSKIHDPYSMAICFNRQQQLRGYSQVKRSEVATESISSDLDTCLEAIKVDCRVPPRDMSSNWPYYTDNTVFGEDYAQMTDIESVDDGENNWKLRSRGWEDIPVEAPTGGWLVVACFHVLWSTGSLKVMPLVNDIVPLFQNSVTFVSVRADCLGLDKVAKGLGVKKFPTIMVLRGGNEVDRVEGSDRVVEKLMHILSVQLADGQDKLAHEKRRFWVKQEKLRLSGKAEVEEEEDEKSKQMEWTWDGEQCGESMRISMQGMRVMLKDESFEGYEYPAIWEYSVNNSSFNKLEEDTSEAIEKVYRTGEIFRGNRATVNSRQIQSLVVWSVEITSYVVSGLTGYLKDYGEVYLKRKGTRVFVPDEDNYVSKEQQEKDRSIREWKERVDMRRKKLKEEKIGKDVEAMKGTISLLPNTGVHTWYLHWNHEPARNGESDGFGVMSEACEFFGPCPTPCMGGRSDAGASIALYADGKLYHNGTLLKVIVKERKLPKPAATETAPTESKPEESPVVAADAVEPKAEASKPEEAVASAETKPAAEEKATTDAKPEEKKEEEKADVPAPEVIEYAPLFGKGSVVSCTLDTADGGKLTFTVDGDLIDFELTSAFQKLSGTELFPAICLGPLKPVDETEARAKKLKELTELKSSPTPTWNGRDLTNFSDEKLSDFAKDIVNFEIRPSVTLLTEDDLKKREEKNVAEQASALAVGAEEVKPEGETAEKPEGEKPAEEGGADEDKDEEEKNEDAAKKSAVTEVNVPVEKVRWMWESKQGWQLYSKEISKELEVAQREGKGSYTLTIGEQTIVCNLDNMKQTGEDNEDKRLRRHVVGEGLQGQWEMLAMRYEPVLGMSGAGFLATLEKVWSGSETMDGKVVGLGFLTIYSLLTGELRCKAISGGYGGYGGGGYGGRVGVYAAGKEGGGGYGGGYGRTTSSSDAFRFAVLMAQLMIDVKTKALPASVVNVLCRNRQVSLRMPKFKDNRKTKNVPFINGWTDEAEPRSPLGELFTKLVPLMTQMKRKGAFHFPPLPPHPELPAPATSYMMCTQRSGGSKDQLRLFENIEFNRPILSDFSCDSRFLCPIQSWTVDSLATMVRYRFGGDALRTEPPRNIEYSEEFDKIFQDNPERLVIADFTADWCGPSRAVAPIFRFLALNTPTATFVRVDIDQVEDLAERFEVQSVPYVCFIRGGPTKEFIKDSVTGFGPEFLSKFCEAIYTHSTDIERQIQTQFREHCPGENLSKVLSNISSTNQDVDTLAAYPLADVSKFIIRRTRKELGVKEIDAELAFDISRHESANTTVAQSILTRIRDDVTAYATVANNMALPKIIHLADTDVQAYFTGDSTAEATLKKALEGIKLLQQKLVEVRDADSKMVQEVVPLLQKASNWVDLSNKHAQPELITRIRFMLLRTAGLNASMWTEFLFGALLSSKSEADLLRLNPFLGKDAITVMMNLCVTSMLRANRVGHANRCIGAVIDLERLLTKILAIPRDKRVSEGSTMLPKLVQAAEDLAKNVTMVRYYMRKVHNGKCEFDPRYLVFEFVWNLQLRQKQVEIVNNFRSSLKQGTSKVKQMIMGAGKTSVVAPLLALILADGKSLVLSVVPKALVEMSRARMRETFAVIMVKRIYTLDFDRSTTVKPAMRRSLENAARNRGVVVATPTTIKSVMLAYVEVLRQLKEAYDTGIKSKLEELKVQTEELSKILRLFDEGVMLLDEVDLILHPLKSELNFPIGEKFDLDGSENGERWSLPIHLIDAIFYETSGRVSTFEARGEALKILESITAMIRKGVEERHLQRLPHITMLNVEFYHEQLKPLMAEWTFLWLQKQHLYGINQQEALQYMLEGAAARSDTKLKLKHLNAAVGAIHDMLHRKGERADEETPLSPAKFKMMKNSQRPLLRSTSSPAYVPIDEARVEVLKTQLKHLTAAKTAAEEHNTLVYEIHNLDDELGKQTKEDAKIIDELQDKIKALNKSISDIECPRDDSLDNSVVVWLSNAFSLKSTQAAQAIGNTAQAASASPEVSVSALCSSVEDIGMTVRRCGESEEAITKARESLLEGQLRCVVLGGSEKVETKKRNETNKVQEAINYMDIVKQLTDKESAYARKHGALDPSRIAIYSSQSLLKEEDRMTLWTLGVMVTDDPVKFLAWTTSLPEYRVGSGGVEDVVDDGGVEESKGEEGEAADESSKAQDPGVILAQLAALRSELDDVETRKASAIETEEHNKKKFHTLLAEKNAVLVSSVDHRIKELVETEKSFEVVLAAVENSIVRAVVEDQFTVVGKVGTQSAREAALATAWLETHRDLFIDARGGPKKVSTQDIEKTDIGFDDIHEVVRKHLTGVRNEIIFLKQMTLATKVIAHVTVPMHKKLLNLCHHWLATFLPHCLAKVNRVSFGLLSEADCKAALKADPNVPRSRLKLAVPFVGKDVPSQSSEFAHPDVIIGLTVMAYRYSGLRKEDYLDLIDNLTQQFNVEIGPPRDREANLRHENWVYAAGGKIRGLKTTKDGLKWLTNENDDSGDKEVVQLKFLQKSNEEQMEKLFGLFKLEPQVIHHYLQKTIFPVHMRSQQMKISASGQAVGGDMLVSQRVGFSGTPSDLLPKELGKCDYETGDDGMMLTTVLNRKVASYEFLKDGWTVEGLLKHIATSETPRFNALIDTGALITGYSNLEVARKLLEFGLVWCEGIVFLDDQDRQQVLVRATDRVVSADQCGVTLEKRFAFYDQIHTTGMDIKHVVNATAVVTLGKDMVFRDYVQGAYRMRGLGIGQKIHVFIIPEVAQLIRRELRTSSIPNPKDATDHVLEDIVAWLIVNSLRSEQVQWVMLCLQNITNLYRKTAFRCVRKFVKYFLKGQDATEGLEEEETMSGIDSPANRIRENFVRSLDKWKALALFDEPIDFSLDAGVPDARPFDVRLRDILIEYRAFIPEEQYAIGEIILEEVGHFANTESSANRLDTEQEREQEQEQEKEVEARKDKQIEVEKFVEREYSRQEEMQRPWPFYLLSKQRAAVPPEDHPFYPLRDFKLRYQEPLGFPSNMFLSANFFNPNWNGLRRVKNVVMVMEYSPSTTSGDLRLLSIEETRRSISEEQEIALNRAHTLLGFHAHKEGKVDKLSRQDVVNAVQAIMDEVPSSELVDEIFQRFSKDKNYLTLAEFRSLVTCGILQPRTSGRYWVALSLAEAETIRRILHVRKDADELIKGANTAVALRYSLMSGPGAPLSGDGGVVLDVSRLWANRLNLPREVPRVAPKYEASMVHSAFRFFDCDMHYAPPALNILIRELQGSVRDREIFFQSVIGSRRRMDIKWQETPLARVFYTAHEWMALKQRAQAIFIKEALAEKGLTKWEAFTAFDYDNSGVLSPSECYGALLWIGVPNLTAEDVADFIDSADLNRDGDLDYKEYIDMLMDEDDDDEEEQTEVDPNGAPGEAVTRKVRVLDKVDPHGAEELREVLVKRKQAEQTRNKLERQRRQKYQEELDLKVFEEELEASKKRKGGANPAITPVENLISTSSTSTQVIATDYNFDLNQPPLRFVPSGKHMFLPLHHGTHFLKPIQPLRCSKNHSLRSAGFWDTYWDRCTLCRTPRPEYMCMNWCGWYACAKCYDSDRRSKEADQQNPAKHPTFLRCANTCHFTLQVPTKGGADAISGCFSVSIEVRFDKLPPEGQLQSLLRLTLPDTVKSSKHHRATLYLDPEGVVISGESSSAKAMKSVKFSTAKLAAMLKSKVVEVLVLPDTGEIPTHDHPLTKDPSDSGWWVCDGRHQPGGCKSGLREYTYQDGIKRWRCSSCDYNVCEACMKSLYKRKPKEKEGAEAEKKKEFKVGMQVSTKKAVGTFENLTLKTVVGTVSRVRLNGSLDIVLFGGETLKQVPPADVHEIKESSSSPSSSQQNWTPVLSSLSKVVVSTHEHPLLRSTVDDGWACSGMDCAGGCKSGITDFYQTSGMDRWRCESCDYDFCDKCAVANVVNANNSNNTDAESPLEGVVCKPVQAADVKDEDKVVSLRAGVWYVITTSVLPDDGRLSIYVNGRFAGTAIGIDTAELRLQHKIVLFGGGKAAQSKGGDIHRIVIHSTALDDEGAMKAFFTIANQNIAIGGRAVKIQAVYRGWATRLREKRLRVEEERMRLENKRYVYKAGQKLEWEHEDGKWVPAVVVEYLGDGKYDIKATVPKVKEEEKKEEEKKEGEKSEEEKKGDGDKKAVEEKKEEGKPVENKSSEDKDVAGKKEEVKPEGAPTQEGKEGDKGEGAEEKKEGVEVVETEEKEIENVDEAKLREVD